MLADFICFEGRFSNVANPQLADLVLFSVNPVSCSPVSGKFVIIFQFVVVKYLTSIVFIGGFLSYIGFIGGISGLASQYC